MPWLTIHIAMPMILASGWAVGWLFQWGNRFEMQTWGWRQSLRVGTLAFLFDPGGSYIFGPPFGQITSTTIILWNIWFMLTLPMDPRTC